MRLLANLALLALWITCVACQGGGTTPDPEPAKSNILAVRTDSILRVHCSQSSADPGTIAQAVFPYFGQDTVDDNGGFTITIDLPQASSRPSQAISEVHLNYSVDGVVQLAKVPVSWLSARVTKPLFSTGAGPNDMVFGNESLYVANSLDNTVVRYGLDGAELATATFDEYASPSYLGLGGDTLYVLTNGDNHLYGYDAHGLGTAKITADIYQALDMDAVAAAFPGPGVPACTADAVYFPLAMITAFDASTVYGEALILRYPVSAPDAKLLKVPMIGRNGFCCAINPATGDLLATSAGEIQFDEFWTPYADTHSYLEIYPREETVLPISLGKVGAGRVAAAPDGSRAYLGNSLNGNLYSVDLEAQSVLRGEDNPIVLTEEFTYVSDVAYTPDGKYILATSFNTDELYVIGAATDEVNPGPYPAPFDLSLDPELLAGCANVEIDPTPRADGGFDAYVLYGVGNAVAKVELF